MSCESVEQLVNGEEEKKDIEEKKENEKIRAARALLKVKEAFKLQTMQEELRKQTADIHQHETLDLMTSDIEYELKDVIENAQVTADFALEINLHIYINRSLKRNKNLSDMIRNLFNLAVIEESIIKKIDIFEKDLEIVHCKIIVCVNIFKITNQSHDLEDFSLEKTDCVLILIDDTHEQHLCSKIILSLEIQLSEPLKQKPSKCRVSDTDSENFLLPPSFSLS